MSDAELAVRRRRRPPMVSILFWVVVTCGVLGIGAGYAAFGVYAASQQHRADDLRQTVAEKNAEIAKKDEQLAKLFANYTKSVNDCTQSAGCESTTPDPDVIQQIIEGTPGPAGQNGQNATDAQVFVQLQNLCSTTLLCKGDTGAAGSAGSNGSDGAQGATGAQGPQGDPGPQGPAGSDGRGIASTVCDGSGEWQVTYTDGTTQDAGSCRTSLIG